MSITYEHDTARNVIIVRFEKKTMGRIWRELDGSGYFYQPKSSARHRGETFPTVRDVKNSLEAR